MIEKTTPSTPAEHIPSGFDLLHTFSEHGGTVYSMAWSPDGRMFASGATDSAVRLWDAQSGELRWTLDHKSVVSVVEWSPAGRMLASGLWDNTVYLWDSQNGELHSSLNHDSIVSSMAWSPDGRTLASGTSDKSIHLWNVQSGKLQRILEGHNDGIISLAWSPDGKTLASGSDDQTIRLWDVQSGNLYGTLKGHHGEVISVLWSPDGRTLCSGSIDETIHLWDAQSGDLRRTLEGYYGNTDTITWSPDGRILASGAWNETIHLLNAETGLETTTLRCHTNRILCIRFSPDGRVLASKSKDDAIRCWRCDTWELIAVLTELSSPIFGGLAFHPHDPVLATRGERGNSIHIWQLDYNVLLLPTTSADTQPDRDEEFILMSDSSDFTVGTVTSNEKLEGEISQKIVPEASPPGLELLHTFGESDAVICDIAWSPDGRILASGSTDHTVHLQDSQNGELLRTLKGHSDTIDSVLWSPDGHTLASGSADHTICLWNSESGELIHTLKGHHAGVLSVTWSPDGQILASGSRDKTVRFWDSQNADLLLTLEGHLGPVYSVAWSPDKRILASASFDQTICLWNGRTGGLLQMLDGRGGAVTSVAWAPNSEILASGFADNTIHLWDMQTGRELFILEGHTDSILCVRFSPDGRLLASKSYDSTIRLWSCESGGLLTILIEPTAMMNFNGLAFHPKEIVLATRGEGDKILRIWRLDEHKLLPETALIPGKPEKKEDILVVQDATEFMDTREALEAERGDLRSMVKEKAPPGFELLHTLREFKGIVSGIAWSPDGQMLTSGSDDHTIRIWDVQSEELHLTLEGHSEWVSSVAWSPDGQYIGSGAFDRNVCLWNAQSGERIRTLEAHRNDVSSVAWAPDGQILASGSRDQTICLWNSQNGDLIRTFKGHRGPVYDVEWSPDGKTLASASFDKTIRLWDVQRGIPRLMLRGHDGPITSTAFSPDGLTLASGSHDNTVRLWHVETGRLISILENHTDTVFDVCFSPDGLLLASKAYDGTVRLWRCDSGDPVAVLVETVDVLNFAGLAFHPTIPILATRGEGDRIIRIWRLDYSLLLGTEALSGIRPRQRATVLVEGEVGELVRDGEVHQELQPKIPPEHQALVPAGFTLLHKLSRHESLLTELAWSPDGHILASGSRDNTICLWDGKNGELYAVLEGHEGPVTSIAWAPDSQMLASASSDATIRIWDAQNGKLSQILEGHADGVLSIAWAPDGWMLASGSDDQTVRLWNSQSGDLAWTFEGHGGAVTSVLWSLDSETLISASFDNTVRVWDAQRGELLRTLEGYGGAVTSVAWSPDTQTIVSGFLDHTIRLWNSETGRQSSILESHTDIVLSVRFSPDGRLLASKSDDGTVRLWRGDSGVPLAVLDEPTDVMNFGGLAFHPEAPILATRGEEDKVIRIWQLDYETLLKAAPHSEARYYRNAKVVLVGDTGTGKSGLSLVLTGRSWEATESTHGRHVWMFDSHETVLPTGQRETRETLLWDLAGQPDYRLIHQLYLNEVVVALVVFDASSEIEAFSGVRHWARALHLAHRLQSNATLPLKKLLVAARCDRSGLQISRERIDAILKKFEFDGFFETSAKEGWQIPELIDEIQDGIDWEALPKVSSSELFQIIKQFLVNQKQAGQLLSSSNDLYLAFCQTHPEFTSDRNLRSKFDTCIGRVENRDLIRRLSFGGYVLLQPELLDAYASALINAARSQPDGLGFVSEEDGLTGHFKMSEDERVSDQEQEKLLLIATVEELLRHELVLKEVTDTSTEFVFPSQITREQPDEAELPDNSVSFTFEGPLLNVYAMLTVRLSQSGLFSKKERWKNAATYTAEAGGTCGIALRELDEGEGELSLFFDENTSETTQYQFEDYVIAHLKRLALPNTVQRQQIIVCKECGELIPDSMVKRLRERDRTTMSCPICEHEISLLGREERQVAVDAHALEKMDRAADAQRERDTAAMILKGKVEAGDFDVFLCHNSKDKPAVKAIGENLKERGLLPWLDEWEFRPGFPWQKTLEAQIDNIKSAAVFIGSQGIGPWQDLEIDAFLRKFVNRRCPVIPIILEGCKGIPKLPVFLEGMMWVDFRREEPDPLEQLIWGITGEKRML